MIEYSSAISTVVEQGIELVIEERKKRVEIFTKIPEDDYLARAQRQYEDALLALEWSKEQESRWDGFRSELKVISQIVHNTSATPFAKVRDIKEVLHGLEI